MNTRYEQSTRALIAISLAAVLLAGCAGAVPSGAPVIATRPVERQREYPAAEPAVAPTSAPQATLGPKAITEQESSKQWPETTATAGRAIAVQPTAAAAAERDMPPTPAPTPADNTFRDYGVNPFIDTYEDHLSTFALDVDTASYAVTRRYLMDGNLPPMEAVRVEEFVNAFEQGYPKPRDVAFAVYADGARSPFHGDGSYILRFGVQGYDVPASERKPASLTFVIDVSGSMREGGRLEMVKTALSMLVERLRGDDSVGIVVFTSNAWVALNPTSGANKNDILNAIYSLTPQNSTNADAGLRLGYTLAQEMYREGAINRVVMCSDGVANTGTTDPNALVEFVRGYAQQGVMLTTIGVGMGNYNDVLLEQLADRGNGFYAYVDTPEEAQKLFLERLTGTLQTIALDAKVQVDFNQDVVARYRLIGYENRAVADQDFRNDAVDAGEIGAGHTATALYAVQFRPNAQGRIATVQLRWQDPDTREVREINGNVNTFDLATDFYQTTPRYQLAVTVMQFAEVLRQSPWAQGTSFITLRNYAARISAQLPEDRDAQEFASLVERASQIGR